MRDSTIELLKTMDLLDGIQQIIESTNRMLREVHGVPEQIREEMILARKDELVVMVGERWEKHFSEEEIVDLTAFMKTPLGQKLTKLSHVMGLEGYREGVEWGKRVEREGMMSMLLDESEN